MKKIDLTVLLSIGNGLAKCRLLICIVMLGTIISCHTEKSEDEMETVITKVDMEAMARELLPGYELNRANILYIFGREFVFTKDKDVVFVTIGLHETANKADSIAQIYINDFNGKMQEGEYLGLSIGDKLWWSPTNGSQMLTNILFRRRNALVIFSYHNNQTDLEQLAKKMDDDFLKAAGYVDLGTTMVLPVIDSITISKPVLKEGETTKITIHVFNLNNEPLEYSAVGVTHYNVDPENVFTERAVRGYIEAPFFATHQYGAVVMNKSNAISEETHFQITVIE